MPLGDDTLDGCDCTNAPPVTDVRLLVFLVLFADVDVSDARAVIRRLALLSALLRRFPDGA